jgi:hypothetical protein
VARFIIGGRELLITPGDVVRKMDGVEPEQIHQHLVNIAGVAFPPKQVMEQISGFGRRSYTTMEALRVLTKLGFVTRRVEAEREEDGEDISGLERRLALAEAGLAVTQEAVAGLRERILKLEARVA